MIKKYEERKRAQRVTAKYKEARDAVLNHWLANREVIDEMYRLMAAYQAAEKNRAENEA